MAITIHEKHGSPEVARGPEPSAVLRYNVMGTADQPTVFLTVEGFAPIGYDIYGDEKLILPRGSIRVTDLGDKKWEAEVEYTPTSYAAGNGQKGVFEFDTTGNTEHITNSLKTVGRFRDFESTFPTATLAPAPDYQGAIGVTPNGIEGTDIVVPGYKFSERHFFAPEFISGAWKANVYFLTGRVNAAKFRDFNAGEVLFLGARGSKRGNGDWDMVFRFSANPNQTNIIIGNINNWENDPLRQGFSKKGWEYLWIRYEDTVDDNAKALVKRPLAAYVEQTYWDGDFSLMGIGE